MAIHTSLVTLIQGSIGPVELGGGETPHMKGGENARRKF